MSGIRAPTARDLERLRRSKSRPVVVPLSRVLNGAAWLAVLFVLLGYALRHVLNGSAP